MKLALFPLPIFLLPGGFTRLRIFELRYLYMIKEAAKTEQGFVLCPYVDDMPYNVPSEGVHVKIVDFSQDDDGQLLIDVEAVSRVSINGVEVDSQSLRYGKCEIIDGPPWQCSEAAYNLIDDSLVDKLHSVFTANPVLDDLYREKHFTQPLWVVYRWLEILPISMSQKLKIKQAQTFEQVADFLHTVLDEK
ncbi:LON peptidase substrate-binding domain-containing protein [Pseudoalteromonas sp. Isolate6]|uniref:LON peptidase substrate-binding domain-containing protein n=1 Tax=Pseudoalteromonas sp. Isolate6 TaxID=2908527 RepID=UPI001EFDE7D1|nr:LON peptidase substrate-binding domain-containing protein [Pseudoalteromonas sp. Isolate6]MCG9761014.1 LON peptidase substrate-binding domain-containing protein [Pseudoalteromonas sp. Isolate6]